MKNLVMSSIVFVLAFFISSGFSMRENPQDPPRGEKKQHVKIMKIKDGEKVELDTFISGDKAFVFDGDTINAKKEAFKIGDDMKFDFDMDISDDENGQKIIIMKSENAPCHMIKKIRMEGDSVKKVFITVEGDTDKLCNDPMIWMNKDGIEKKICMPHMPDLPCFEGPQNVKIIRKQHPGNVIDLSDPGIISYKKKKLSDGREKIEIIRNEVIEGKEVEVGVDVIVDDKEVEPKIEKIKVIKGEKLE